MLKELLLSYLMKLERLIQLIHMSLIITMKRIESKLSKNCKKKSLKSIVELDTMMTRSTNTISKVGTKLWSLRAPLFFYSNLRGLNMAAFSPKFKESML